jgi:hypothetical protein
MNRMEKRRIRRGVQCVRACLGIVVTVTSAACVPSPEAPHHTVEYYRDHPADRAEMMAACANDPGALAKTPDCVNARVAASQADIGSLRELPPMGMSGSKADGATQAEPDSLLKGEQSQ